MNRSSVVGILVILLLLTMVVGFCVYDTMARAWILPRSISSIGQEIDFMYEVILYVVLGMFLLTEVLLIVFCFLYRERSGHRAGYTHGNNKAEIIWTIIPGVMLFSLAVWQKAAWTKAKFIPEEEANKAVKVEVLAQQFTWFFRYSNVDEKTGAEISFGKDVDVVNAEKQLVAPAGRPVLLQMRSRDVIHSFFLPMLRVKQDVVPGMTLPSWFKATAPNAKMIEKTPPGTPWDKREFDFEILADPNAPNQKMMSEIACAELCGPQHYAMSGQIIILPEEDFNTWLKAKRARANRYKNGMDIDEKKDWGWPWQKTDW